MNNPQSLANKTFLVLGGSSGIGKQIAIDIALLGGKVIAAGRNEIKLNACLEVLAGDGHSIIAADLLDSSQIEYLKNIDRSFDGVVVSSGMMGLIPPKFLDEHKLTDFINVNYIKPASIITHFLKNKKINNGGSIVFITSINGSVVGSPANSAYGASKGALHSFSKALAIDVGKNNIRVNCIAPGMIETEGFEAIKETVSAEAIELDIKKYPLKRYGTPKDVSNACMFLLSEASSWITGTTLILDGGFTAQ